MEAINIKLRLGREEVRTVLFWRDVLCELVCSSLLLTYLTFNHINYWPWWRTTPVQAGLVCGLAVTALIEAFGHISGCHMHPGISLVMLCRGQLTLLKALFYCLAQCVGSVVGTAIVYGLTPPSRRSVFGPFMPAEGLGPWRAMGLEAVISAFFMLVVLGVTDPSRRHTCPVPGLIIGGAVATNIMCTVSSTGGAMNPIIVFGPAVVSANFRHHWVYWAGPMLGAAIALLIYSLLMVPVSVRASPDVSSSSIKVPEMERGRKYQANGTDNHGADL